jgi:two-component system sensor histidine kinase BaeS
MLLQGRIEAMQDGVVPFDEAGLATLHTETLRLSRLIGQIERLAESEAQPPPLCSGDVPLDEVAREAHAALAAAFEMRGLTLQLNPEPAAALADRDAVLQIVTNLLSNALKYAPDGPPVRLSTGIEDGQAVLRVHDAGRGAEVDARVFERFHRGSEAAWQSGGEGLDSRSRATWRSCRAAPWNSTARRRARPSSCACRSRAAPPPWGECLNN